MRRKAAISFLIALLLLALALRGVPFADVGAALARLRPGWLIPVAVLFFLQQLLRAWRQQVIVGALRPGVRFASMFHIAMAGFLMINVLPARLGEAARPWLLREREGLPLGSGFAVIVVERALDLMMILGLLSLCMQLVTLEQTVLEIPELGASVPLGELVGALGARALPLLSAGLLLVLIVGRPLLALGERVAEAMAGRRWLRLPARIVRLGLGFAGALVEGLAVIRQPGRLALLLVQTASLWGLTVLSYVSLSLGFGVYDQLGPWGNAAALAITMLGLTLPAPPGFIGVYESVVRASLALFGVPGDVGMAYGLVFHYGPFLLLTLTGLLSLRALGIAPSTVADALQAADAHPVRGRRP